MAGGLTGASSGSLALTNSKVSRSRPSCRIHKPCICTSALSSISLHPASLEDQEGEAQAKVLDVALRVRRAEAAPYVLGIEDREHAAVEAVLLSRRWC